MGKATDKAKNKLTSLAKEFVKKVAELGIGDGDDENQQLINKELSKINESKRQDDSMFDLEKNELETKVEEKKSNKSNKSLTEEEAIALTKKQMEDKDPIVVSGDGVARKIDEEFNDEINPDLLATLKHIKEFFNLSSINEVLAYLITIADVLANDEELAKMVLVETKNQDGTLSEADLASLMADIKTVNGNEEEDNAVLNDLQTKSGLPIEKIDEIAKQLRIEGKEDLINNPNSFLIELEKRGNATPEVARDLEKGLDGVVAEMNQYKPIKPEVKIKTISLNKKDKRPEGENFQQLVSRKMKQFGL